MNNWGTDVLFKSGTVIGKNNICFSFPHSPDLYVMLTMNVYINPLEAKFIITE